MAKHLHPIIYIVADKPSKTNVSPNVPLVGTSRYRTLLLWLGSMNVDVSRVRFFHQCDKPFSNPLSHMTLKRATDEDQIKVITLGKKAKNYLTMLDIKHFDLPHPGGVSKRQLNMILKNCKGYIYAAKTQSPNEAPAEPSRKGQDEVQSEKSH